MNSEKQIIHIGKTYIIRREGFSRLCADITIGKHRITFWFAVDTSQEDFLCIGRADAFVVALLPTAMRDDRDIVCEDLISEKLLYRLNNYLIPTLTFAGNLYHMIHIHAAYTTERYPSRRVVGTGFSGGADCLYTIMSHGADSEYLLDYIAVYNTGNIESGFGKEVFWESCRAAARFAEEQNLQVVCVDTNFSEVLPENYMQVYSYRNLACTLALQGLFSVYLLSSEGSTATFRINVYNCSRYDFLTVNCIATETLTFYLAGTEKKRWQKIEALTEWEPSYRWQHSCTAGIVTQRNCGHCKKCIHDLTVLYILGQLEKYEQVFDVEDYRKHFAERIAFVLSRTDNDSNEETKQLLKERNILIPKAAYIYKEQFCRAMQNLRKSEVEKRKEC